MPNKLKKLHEERGEAVGVVEKLRDIMNERSLSGEEEQKWDDATSAITDIDLRMQKIEQGNEYLKGGYRSKEGDLTGDNIAPNAKKDDECRTNHFDIFMKRSIGMNLTDAEQRVANEVLTSRDSLNIDEMHQRAITTANGSGAAFVPTTFASSFHKALETVSNMRPHVTVFTTTDGRKMILPTASDLGNTGAWMDENTVIPTAVDPSLGSLELNAFALTSGWFKITHEMIRDSAFDIQSFIAQLAGERIGRSELDAFTNGDGDKKPTGILNAITLQQETALQNALSFDDIFDLMYVVDEAYRLNGKFMMNDKIMKDVRKLKDSQGRYLLDHSTKLGEPDSILTKPVITNSKMNNEYGASKTLLTFGDLTSYKVRDVSDMTLNVSLSKFEDYNAVGVRLIKSLDGKLVNAGEKSIAKLVTPA